MIQQPALPGAAIAASHLGLDRGSRRVLDDLSLSIAPGSVVGLVGANGAGKSTLLRCLVGLSVPARGASELLGCPSLALDDPTRERLGYVAQSPDLFEWMDMWEHIETIGRAYARWSPERALRLAVQLGVPLGRRAGTLSAGDQQKLAVVLALAHDPDVLLLDEPVASLDPLARRAFMRSLFVHGEGELASAAADSALLPGIDAPRTVLISSHLLGDLERVVSHVAFLRDGRIQLYEAWDAVAEHLRVVDADAWRLIGGALPMQPHPQADGAPPVALHVARDGRALLDNRRSPMAEAAGRPVGMDDLFVLLNT